MVFLVVFTVINKEHGMWHTKGIIAAVFWVGRKYLNIKSVGFF